MYMRRPKLIRTKTISKVSGAGSLNKIINRAIMRSLETKENQLTLGATGLGLPIRQNIAEVDVYDLIPTVSQGTGQASRVGNRIRPVKFTATVQLYVRALGFTAQPTYIDVYIFKIKNKNPADGLPTLFEMQNFLQDDNAAKQYFGNSLDGVRPVNSDLFTLIKKKRVRLYNAINNSATVAMTNPEGPSTTLYFDLTRYIKKHFVYNDNSGLLENDNLLICCGCTQVDGISIGDVATTILADYRVITNLKYKDA